MKKLIPLLTLLAAMVVHIGYGNDDLPTAQPLDQQFQVLIGDVEVVEGYRMVRAFEVERFWKAVTDSIKQKQAVIVTLGEQKLKLEGDITNLKKELESTNASLNDLSFASKHIHVFGYDFKKSSFLITGILIAAGLLIVIGLLVMSGEKHL